MSNIYVLSYHEVQISGYRMFSTYEHALREYLHHCIIETKSIMNSPENSLDGSDDDDEDTTTCVLEVCELGENGEYNTIKE